MNEGKSGPKFSPNLWSSLGRQPKELNCERAFYQRHVDVSQNPSVMYRFVAETKSRGHSSSWMQNIHRVPRKDNERREKKSETRCVRMDGDVDSNRPFTTCLRRNFQQDTKEALCLLGLKKKIARLYAHEPERHQKEEEENQGLTGKSHGRGRKRSTPKTEAIPARRKRGRPPKNKTKQETPKHEIPTEGQQWKCMPHSEEPLKVRISRSRGKRETKSVIRALAPPRLCPARRARPSKRSLLIDDGSNSSSCSDSVEEEERHGEEEVDVDVKNVSKRRRRRKLFNDEALALQLHLDLNAPMLRRRRRSGGLMSPSSTEQ